MTTPSIPKRLRLLVLSWNYPTSAAPQRGLWVERMCDAVSQEADVHVIVPTPWVPPLMPLRSLSRFRTVPVGERRGGVTIHYPRVPGSIEYHTHALDARLSRRTLLRLARRLHAEQPFDLIHAHFVFPDGVVASEIGRALGIPVVTSEHAFWTPWLTDNRRQRRQVDAALPDLQRITCVSEFLRGDVESHLAGRVPTAVLPNVVDDQVFTIGDAPKDPDEVLYVGLVRGFKRIDVLVEGFAIARRSRPSLKLRILSANGFNAYGSNRRAMRDLIAEHGVGDAVSVVSGASPSAVAAAMQRAALVAVSSSRRETFCSVAAEALACGTPLIITRCGGPEEFVTESDGVMVAADDPVAFAAGILRAIGRRETFDGAAMRARIVERFGRDAWRAQALALYRAVVSAGRRPGA